MSATRRVRVLVALAFLLAIIGAASSQVGPIDTIVERSSTVDHRDLGAIALPRTANRFDVHDVGRASPLPFAVLAAGAWSAVLVALGVVVVSGGVSPGRRTVDRAVVRGPPGSS